MAKASCIGAPSLRAGSSRGLTVAELDRELDRCPDPSQCADGSHCALRGCAQRRAEKINNRTEVVQMAKTEGVSEFVNGNEMERQWGRNGSQRDNTPSARQLAFITTLAQRVGKQVNVRGIKTKEAASGTIAELLEIGLRIGAATKVSRTASGTSSSAYDERDRRIAFGMSTKLVYSKYTTLGRRLDDEFWPEVRSLYSAYQTEQERAVRSKPLLGTPARGAA